MFVSRIREIRLKMGINQTEFGNLVNLSQTEISSIEGNKTRSLLALEKISSALGICIYSTFYYSCKEYDSCAEDNRPNLGCYMDLEYRKDKKNKNKV